MSVRKKSSGKLLITLSGIPFLFSGIISALILVAAFFLEKFLVPGFFVAVFLIAFLVLFVGVILLRRIGTLLLETGILLSVFSFVLIDNSKPHRNPFNDLIQIKQVSEALEQKKIEMDNSNLLKPLYDKYYQTTLSGFWGKRITSILTFLKLRPPSPWNVPDFLYLLKKTLAFAQEKNLPKSDYVCKISLSDQARVIVFGDLQGAFSSLFRCCEKLKDLSVLDENLKIKSPNDFIVVTGDAVSRSPFQLETLSLILRLWLNNSTQFIYLKGNHESDDYWQEFNLKSELAIRVGSFVKSEKLPMGAEVSELFLRMPSAVYFGLPYKSKPGFLRVSHYGAERSALFSKDSQNKLAKFLTASSDLSKLEIMTFNAVRDEAADKDIPLNVIIKSEKKRETYEDMDGLRQMNPENGVTAWTVMSCPTEVYQKGLKFFYDAFVVVTIGKEPASAKITLYKQDVRSKKGFESREAALLSGKAESGTEASSDSEKKEKKGDGGDAVNPDSATAVEKKMSSEEGKNKKSSDELKDEEKKDDKATKTEKTEKTETEADSKAKDKEDKEVVKKEEKDTSEQNSKNDKDKGSDKKNLDEAQESKEKNEEKKDKKKLDETE